MFLILGCWSVCFRQMVARSLLDTLRAVSEDERECVSVLERIDRLADDSGTQMIRWFTLLSGSKGLFLIRYCYNLIFKIFNLVFFLWCCAYFSYIQPYLGLCFYELSSCFNGVTFVPQSRRFERSSWSKSHISPSSVRRTDLPFHLLSLSTSYPSSSDTWLTRITWWVWDLSAAWGWGTDQEADGVSCVRCVRRVRRRCWFCWSRSSSSEETWRTWCVPCWWTSPLLTATTMWKPKPWRWESAVFHSDQLFVFVWWWSESVL